MRRYPRIPPDDERCSKDNVSDGTGWHFGRCKRRGTVKENDKLWCKQHSPSATKARRQARSERWDAAQNARMAPYREAERLKAINHDLLAALEEIGREAARRGAYAKTTDETYEMAEDFEVIEKLADAAIKKAKP